MLKAAIAAVATLAVAASAGAATPSVTGRIVFSADHAAAVAGHIYVVQPGGEPVDLSASSAGFDSSPAVSPDGKHIAFVSTRTGRQAVYTMAIDGSDVARVSPFFSADEVHIVWRQGSGSFAVAFGTRPVQIDLGTLGGGWRTLVPASRDPGGIVGWSPDGKLLAYMGAGGPAAVDLAGRRVFDLVGLDAAWSATGRLAVQTNTAHVSVYSEQGKALATIAGPESYAWSPDGKRLATLTQTGVLQLRAGGVGTPTSSMKVGGRAVTGLRFLGETHVLVETDSGRLALDLHTGKSFEVPVAFSDYFAAFDATGTEAAALEEDASGQSRLLIQTLQSSRDVATFPECGDGSFEDDGPAADDLQLFAGGGLVYESDCRWPSASIYTVAPDGSGLARLTNGTEDDEQLAVSHDASTIAFVRSPGPSCNSGCAQTLLAMNADGTGVRPLVTPSESLPYSYSPSFSPDGTQVMFVRGGAVSSQLDTVPAAGGSLHILPPKASEETVAWGPGQVAFVDSKGLEVADPDGSHGRLVAKASSFDQVEPAWSADGRLALLVQRNSALSILEVASGKRIALAGFRLPSSGWGRHIPGLTWSPDGTRLAFTAATPTDPYGDVWTIGVDGAGLIQVTHGAGAVSSLSWR